MSPAKAEEFWKLRKQKTLLGGLRDTRYLRGPEKTERLFHVAQVKELITSWSVSNVGGRVKLEDTMNRRPDLHTKGG